jgi:hypothetical protein
VLDLATLILGVPTIRWWLRTLIRVLGLTAIVTNRRVFIQRITFGLSREVLPNGGLTMVRVRKSPLGSIFHFGSLFLPATANSAARELRDMRDPEDLERVMQMVGNGVVNGTWPMARRQTIIP